jgi:hypothetical protein
MKMRQTANFFWYLFTGRIQWFFHDKLWKSDYFWQDTIFTRFNRLIGCRIFGHKIRSGVNKQGDLTPFCFRCYKEQ